MESDHFDTLPDWTCSGFTILETSNSGGGAGSSNGGDTNTNINSANSEHLIEAQQEGEDRQMRTLRRTLIELCQYWMPRLVTPNGKEKLDGALPGCSIDVWRLLFSFSSCYYLVNFCAGEITGQADFGKNYECWQQASPCRVAHCEGYASMFVEEYYPCE